MKTVIAQSDAVTAYGWGTDALWSGLLSGKTAIRPTSRFDGRGFLTDQAAIVPDLDREAAAAGSRALAMLRRLLGPLKGKLDPQTPLILATTVGQIEYVERATLEHNRHLMAEASPDRLAEQIKQMLGLHGASLVISAACAASAVAMGRAASMVRHGQAGQVLVVACDAISEFVFSGFSGLLGMSEQPARPFDAGRDGLSLGEAAAWALVAADSAPAAANWTLEILGWGSANDAVHMTAPDREGRGAARAIAKACAMAGRRPDQIAFIAAHGTATTFSDAMEMVAFRQVFGAPRPVFSTKGGTGHTLSAAGLLQLLAVQKAFAAGMVPPTIGLGTPDAAALGWVDRLPRPAPAGELAVSTNSGFGGVNSAIVLQARRPA